MKFYASVVKYGWEVNIEKVADLKITKITNKMNSFVSLLQELSFQEKYI